MRNIVAILAVLTGSLALNSCGTTLSVNLGGAAAYADDLYAVHDRAALAAAEAEIAAAEAAAREANEKRIAAMVAAAQAEDDIDAILGNVEVGGSYATVSAATTSAGGNVSIYNNIYVDDYSSAYARRLQGFSSLSYRMPSSYYDYRYGDAYFLTMAYDPAFYTVMIMGDQVWVEPRYITNMFGSWNNPYYYGYRYGYNPYYYGYSYGYYDPWGWNSPYWGCDPFYHYHSHHYWHGPHYGYHDHHHHYPSYHHPGHRPSGPGGPHGGSHHNSRVEYRPSYGTTGSLSYPAGNRPSYNDRLGGGRTNDRGATMRPVAGGSAIRGGSSASAGGSSTRPGTAITAPSARPSGTPSVSIAGDRGGRVDASALLNEDLSGSLNGSTLRGTTPVRGNISTGTSTSGSRGSATSGRDNSRVTLTPGSSSGSSGSRGTSVRIGTGSSSSRSSSSTSTRSGSSSSRGGSSVGSSSRSSSSSSSFRSSGSSSSRSSVGSSSSSSSSSSRGGSRR